LLRDSINEVLLSESLKKNLDEKQCHAEYFRHLKNYQRTICLMNADVIQKFKDEKNPISTSSIDIGNSIVLLYSQVNECITSSDYSTSRTGSLKWSGIQTFLNDSVKVYNTLLKTRYALENLLFSKDTSSLLGHLLSKTTSSIKSLDLSRPHEAACYTIFRFLKSVMELSDFISDVTATVPALDAPRIDLAYATQ
jgi:hypothetical protein